MDSIEHRCLHQIFRPKENHRAMKTDGRGNCYACEYNPKENFKCRGYSPVVLHTFVVTEKIKL